MLRSLRGSCAFFLVALGALALLAAACDNGAPPATPTATVQDVNSDLVTPGDDEDTSDLLTAVAAQVTATPVPTPAGLTQEDSDRIYATVIDALLGEKLPPVVYISPYLGQGERLDEPDETQPVSESLLGALTPESSTKYELGDFTEVIGPLDDGGVVQNNGAFVTLGSIAADPSDPDSVIVHGSIYRKVGDAQGFRFHVVKDPSRRTGWSVSDSTQEWSDNGTGGASVLAKS
jgi:hypothetical protein